jgi:hypothetical protein
VIEDAQPHYTAVVFPDRVGAVQAGEHVQRAWPVGDLDLYVAGIERAATIASSAFLDGIGRPVREG